MWDLPNCHGWLPQGCNMIYQYTMCVSWVSFHTDFNLELNLQQERMMMSQFQPVQWRREFEPYHYFQPHRRLPQKHIHALWSDRASSYWSRWSVAHFPAGHVCCLADAHLNPSTTWRRRVNKSRITSHQNWIYHLIYNNLYLNILDISLWMMWMQILSVDPAPRCRSLFGEVLSSTLGVTMPNMIQKWSKTHAGDRVSRGCVLQDHHILAICMKVQHPARTSNFESHVDGESMWKPQVVSIIIMLYGSQQNRTFFGFGPGTFSWGCRPTSPNSPAGDCTRAGCLCPALASWHPSWENHEVSWEEWEYVTGIT